MTTKELDELESINALLESDEFKAYSALPSLDDITETIPILHDVIAGEKFSAEKICFTDDPDFSAQAFFFDETPTHRDPVSVRPMTSLDPRLIVDNESSTGNPFLPDSIMEKLQRNQEASKRIIEEMNNFVPKHPKPTKRIISSASSNHAYRQLEEKLIADAENILQEIVDEFVPMIEAELRSRLQAEMNYILSDIVEAKVRETLGKEII